MGSIILGIGLGGQLVGPHIAPMLLALDFPVITTSVDTAPEAAISTIVFLYLLAAVFNLRIPRTEAPLQPLSGGVAFLVRDFSHCNARVRLHSPARPEVLWKISENSL